MFITQSGLKKVFALSAVSLYGCGLVATCIATKQDYLRYLDTEVARIRSTYLMPDGQQDYIKLDLCTYQNNQGWVHLEDNDEQDSFNSYVVGFFDINVDYVNKRLDGTLKVGFYNLTYVHSNRAELYYDYNCVHAYMYRSIPITFDYELLDANNQPYTNNIYNLILNPDKTPVSNLMQFGFYFDMDYVQGTTGASCDFNVYWCYGDMYQWQSQTSNEMSIGSYSWDFGQSIMLNYGSAYSLNTRDFDRTMSFDSVSLSNYVISYSWNVGGYQSGYQDATNAILGNPNEYGLYTYAQYLAYGQSQYYAGQGDSNEVLSMSGVMETIFASPVTMFTQIFGSQAFRWTMPNGQILDLGGLMTFLLTIGIALAIVRLIMKIGGK